MTSNTPLISLSLAIITLSILVASLVYQPGLTVHNAFETTKTVRYGFIITNNSSALIDAAKFEVFVPSALTPFQRRDHLEASESFTLITDIVGNQKAVIEINDLPPHGAEQVILTARVSVTNTPNLPREWLTQERLLADETYIESDHLEIKSLSKRIVSANLNDEVRGMHHWVAANIKNVGYIAENRGALYALRKKRGDCSEFAYSIVALARSATMPAVPVAGFMMSGQSGVLKASDYHNWAYIFNDEAWHLSDPMKNSLNESQEEYVSFNLLHQNENLNNSQRFFVADERLSVRML